MANQIGAKTRRSRITIQKQKQNGGEERKQVRLGRVMFAVLIGTAIVFLFARINNDIPHQVAAQAPTQVSSQPSEQPRASKDPQTGMDEQGEQNWSGKESGTDHNCHIKPVMTEQDYKACNMAPPENIGPDH